MEQNGYETVLAYSGEEALEAVSRSCPDLILLDIMLPGIDGFEVCQIIRLSDAWRHTKIIFLTAKGRDVDVAKGMVLGADAYIIKPFSNMEIISKVKELLGEPHAVQD